jgi:RNA polymerase sigma factor (sigma-70 family)
MTEALERLIEQEMPTLLNIFRHHLARAGLEATLTPQELLNEVVIEAMTYPERFEAVEAPLGWLIGVGANLIKRHQERDYRKAHREPLARDLMSSLEHEMSDAEIFDTLTQFAIPDPAHEVEAKTEVNRILALVSTADQEVLRLAILNGLDDEMLAHELGTTPGAARVRLHRALRRLKTVLKLEVQQP